MTSRSCSDDFDMLRNFADFEIVDLNEDNFATNTSKFDFMNLVLYIIL